MQSAEKKSGLGYSPNIEKEEFEKTRDTKKPKDEIFYILILSVAVIVTLAMGIFRYQDIKGTLFFVAIVLVVGGVFFYIFRTKKQPDLTYDGVIKFIDRSEETYRKSGRYLVSYIAITRDDGKIFIYNNIISSLHNDYTTYYHAGDKVRHHKGFQLPEKYDKSNDDKVVCILCGNLVDKQEEVCTKCEKVLLK